ncbi:type III polyketide synthase [Dichotomicrobium thermohalophilum]|uniref:4-hydroxy-3-methyl-6-(1-methyl-2-oxoundecyl)pyran-2-one synthase n=1 Tax=Dichotomicrobium thermohalophilum TaxID=933063 RepID=A0A397Q5X4_9HYPH|nr:type III polyketide synthase [Dichotomicrobium thermohalophilum]RIA56666.1 4-hydroxy-3-methyl-6-(1-methyl-2-oxoundecyl)pyran-2-one synthase [Dichotomicrobium thermohalophilum]
MYDYLADHQREPIASRQPHAPSAQLLGLATAVPAQCLDQRTVIENARRIFGGRTNLFGTLESVYTNAQIDTRYACQPLDWFNAPAGIADKTRSYETHATGLAQHAADRALADASLAAGDIDAIVFVSSTGIATPSIEARLMNIMPFRPDVQRLPVFGLGCAGGVSGMTRAAQMAVAQPGARVLLIVVELCTLAFRYDRLTKSNLVATALFGDGAAAAVLSSEGGGEAPLGALGAGGEHLWQNTLNVMGWDVDDQGFDVIFHRDIPQIVAGAFNDAMHSFLERVGLDPAAIDRPCCHPGGVKVLDALEDVFGIERGGLEAERDVLRGYGNMSAPTVLFVLDELRRRGARGQLLMTALGPGFTGAFQLLTLNGEAA